MKKIILLTSPVSAPTSEKEKLENEVGIEGRVFWSRTADLEHSAFSDNYFDKIVSIGSLFDHPNTFFHKIQSLLKPGGVFILMEPISTKEERVSVYY